ncbi:MAG TPA: GNAT family N-acetyltransferase, partial [Gaiellaceae bacterium]|nr:GNAT family N-acetyltransferase [Gaiellaceae bacterium]
MNVSIRRARPDDVDFLVELVTHEEVEPFLAAVRARSRDELLAEIERSQAEPEAFGLFVIEVDGERAGTMRFERSNRRSRIADLGGLAVHPRFRGRRVGDEAA